MSILFGRREPAKHTQACGAQKESWDSRLAGRERHQDQGVQRIVYVCYCRGLYKLTQWSLNQ